MEHMFIELKFDKKKKLFRLSLFDVLGPDRLVAGVGRIESSQAQGDHPGEQVRNHCVSFFFRATRGGFEPNPLLRRLEGISKTSSSKDL